MFVLLSRIELNFIGLEHALFHQQFELASVLIEGCRVLQSFLILRRTRQIEQWISLQVCNFLCMAECVVNSIRSESMHLKGSILTRNPVVFVLA